MSNIACWGHSITVQVRHSYQYVFAVLGKYQILAVNKRVLTLQHLGVTTHLLQHHVRPTCPSFKLVDCTLHYQPWYPMLSVADTGMGLLCKLPPGPTERCVFCHRHMSCPMCALLCVLGSAGCCACSTKHGPLPKSDGQGCLR